MKLTTSATALFILFSCCYPAAPVVAQNQINKAEIVKQASASYYGVRKSGLIEFQARVTPTWEVAVKDIASNPEALKLLNGLKFTISFDSNDQVKVNHEATIAAPNETAQSGFNQLFHGVEQMLSGFFDTWDLFMLTTPFPPADGDFELKDFGTTYLLTHKEADADIAFTLAKDFRINEVKVVSPAFSSSILPQFTKTEKGYVLNGYSATYVPVKGPGKVDLKIQIDYQDVSGLKLPQRLRAHSVLDGEAYDVELVFSDYQVKTR